MSIRGRERACGRVYMESSTLIPLTNSRTIPHLQPSSLPGHILRNPKSQQGKPRFHQSPRAGSPRPGSPRPGSPRPGSPPLRSPID